MNVLIRCVYATLLLWAGVANAFDLSPGMPVQLNAASIDYFLEQQPLNRDEILEQASALPWQAVNKPTINLHQQRQAAWIRIPLHNTMSSATEWRLMIPWTVLAEVEVNILREDGRWDAPLLSGYDIPRSDWAVDYRLHVFPLRFAADEQVTLYIRARSDIILFLPLMMLSPEEFTAYKDVSNLIYGIGFGVLLAMMLYNLSLFIFVRSLSYLTYSLYVFAIIFYQLALTGFGSQYWWGDTPMKSGYSFMLIAELSFFVAVLFGRQFLKLHRYGGWYLHLNTFMLTYWAAAFVFNALGWHGFARYTFNPMSLASCLIGLFTAIALWRKGDKSARYFTIAWSFVLAGTVLAVLMMLGVVTYNAYTENAQMVSFVVELLLLSFALAERINRERQQRELAQRQSLTMMQQLDVERGAKLAAQEDALRLQKMHSDELELRVLDRTAELERTMKNLELANRELAKLSVTDPLTRLHNRRYFDETLQAELSRAVRTEQPLALILVDIDHFKSINDTYGHLVGDECLKLVAVTLRQVVNRSTDLVARYGGEEFAVVLPATTEMDALDVANRLRAAIEKVQFIHAGKRIAISASLGVAGREPTNFDTPNRFITAADEALYRAKEAGRNRVVAAQLAETG